MYQIVLKALVTAMRHFSCWVAPENQAVQRTDHPPRIRQQQMQNLLTTVKLCHQLLTLNICNAILERLTHPRLSGHFLPIGMLKSTSYQIAALGPLGIYPERGPPRLLTESGFFVGPMSRRGMRAGKSTRKLGFKRGFDPLILI